MSPQRFLDTRRGGLGQFESDGLVKEAERKRVANASCPLVEAVECQGSGDDRGGRRKRVLVGRSAPARREPGGR